MGFVSRIRFIEFGEENSPSDPPKSLFGGGDLPPIVTGIGSTGFRVSSGNLDKWVGFWVSMDTLTTFIENIKNYNKKINCFFFSHKKVF